MKITCLKLILGPFTNPKFHGVYLAKYSELESKIFTEHTFDMSSHSTQNFVVFNVPKKSYSENIEMARLKYQNLKIITMIQKLMNHVKNDK